MAGGFGTACTVCVLDESCRLSLLPSSRRRRPALAPARPRKTGAGLLAEPKSPWASSIWPSFIPAASMGCTTSVLYQSVSVSAIRASCPRRPEATARRLPAETRWPAGVRSPERPTARPRGPGPPVPARRSRGPHGPPMPLRRLNPFRCRPILFLPADPFTPLIAAQSPCYLTSIMKTVPAFVSVSVASPLAAAYAPVPPSTATVYTPGPWGSRPSRTRSPSVRSSR